MPTSGMSCEVFIPEEQKPQKPHRPLKVQVKNRGSFAHGLCLQPVPFTHSTVPFVPHFTISFVHLTSFSTPRVSVSCLSPTLSLITVIPFLINFTKKEMLNKLNIINNE